MLRVQVSAVLRHILPFMFAKPEGEPTWRRDRERPARRKAGRPAGPRKECTSPCLAEPRSERLLPATGFHPGKWKAGPALYPICLGARCLLPRLDSALLQGRNACLKPGRPFLQRSGRSGDTGKFVPCAQQCLAPASHLASSQPREENRARIPALPFYRRRFQCSNSYRAFFGALLSEPFCSPAVLF
ncbi:hypothetical protein MRX96_014259 [Rhipicephalus microplus]